MIVRIPPCFAGLDEYYLDESGFPLFNDSGCLATDSDLDLLLNRPDVSRGIDLLIMAMAAEDRRLRRRLPLWQLDAELAAFQRIRSRRGPVKCGS